MTFYLTDFVGSDAFSDPTGKMRMSVPVGHFAEFVKIMQEIVPGSEQGVGDVIWMDKL